MDRFPEDVYHQVPTSPYFYFQLAQHILCHVIKCCLATLQKMVALILTMKTDDILEFLLQKEQLDQNIIMLGLMVYCRGQCFLNFTPKDLGSISWPDESDLRIMLEISFQYSMHRNNVMQTLSYPSYSVLFFMKVKFRLESFEKS